MRTVEETITPAMAVEFLKRNTNNRNLRPAVVAQYANEMKEGLWRITHQGVAFDINGELLDGQHRLAAIIKSQTTQVMLVTYDVETKSKPSIDTGRQRSIADSLTFQGVRVTPKQGAILRTFILGATPSTERLGNTTLKFMYDKYKDSIEWESLHQPNRSGIRVAPVGAALARAYYYEDLDELERFCRILGNGVTEEDRDITVISLRDALLSDRMGYGRVGAVETFLKTQRSIKGFADGESLSKACAAKRDLYPLT